MTKKEFLSKALLQLMGNSAYGKCSWHGREEWKQSIYTTLENAFRIAKDNDLIDDEPDKPP
jgi:hypothetical protein